MKPVIPRNALLLLMAFTAVLSCSRRHYASSHFDQQTAHHRVIAILPAEMVFTGVQPKNMTPENIKQIEEQESRDFQVALYNSILQYANSRRYYTTVNVQDFATTQRLLNDSNISVRDAWNKSDLELTKILGVDAVVRMRIQKKRYMSDMASYGVGIAKQIGYETGVLKRIPLPTGLGKTNDIYATCALVSKGQTLWNNYYKAASDWNNPAHEIIENITDNFGRNFPYKQRR
jgi:hypothetical protein